MATREQIEKQAAARANGITADAVDGLRDYYPKRWYEKAVSKVRDQLNVPDTGNDQQDYEKVRDQLERLLDDIYDVDEAEAMEKDK